MKNRIYIYLTSILISATSFAQNSGWTSGFKSNGNFVMSSDDGKYSFSPGGRFTFDGAYLDPDITPLASGTTIKEARLNTALKIKKINIFFEIDFARSKVTMKDIFARYNFTDHSFIKAGYYTEPFSANYISTTEKVPFIGRPSMASAFAPPRSLGVSYRHYQRKFWFEGGVFGDDINQTYQGKDGYAFTGRFVYIPIELTNAHLHFGFSASYRTGDSRGLDEDGSGYYNRKLNYTAGLQTSIDTQNFLTAYIGPTGSNNYDQSTLASLKNGGAKDQVQLDFEILDVYKNFFWQFEYIHTRVSRVMNKEKILSLERDGGVYPEVWSDIAYKYGEPRDLNFQGYYIQASYLIFGGDFKYSKYSSTLMRLTKRSLQLSARYTFTSLNDTEGNYINGKFYDNNGLNLSEAGGKTSAISVSLNYVFNANVRFIAEYTNQTINNYVDPDENINMFQGRLQVVF
jgi:phosphate-selective porin OprO/OprP